MYLLGIMAGWEGIILLSSHNRCEFLTLQEFVEQVSHGGVEVACADSFLDGAGFEICH